MLHDWDWIGVGFVKDWRRNDSCMNCGRKEHSSNVRRGGGICSQEDPDRAPNSAIVIDAFALQSSISFFGRPSVASVRGEGAKYGFDRPDICTVLKLVVVVEEVFAAVLVCVENALVRQNFAISQNQESAPVQDVTLLIRDSGECLCLLFDNNIRHAHIRQARSFIFSSSSEYF